MSHRETLFFMIIQLRRNLKRTLFLPLAQSRSAVRSDQVAQGFVQSGLKTCQGWTLHHLPKAPVLVPDSLHEEKCLYIQGKCLFFKLMVTASSCHAPLWWDHSILPSGRFVTVRFPQIHLFSRLNQLHPAASLVAPFWTYSS